eukprot:scaffold6285_cov121-Isochrysis_galbana.AAC.21
MQGTASRAANDRRDTHDAQTVTEDKRSVQNATRTQYEHEPRKPTQPRAHASPCGNLHKTRKAQQARMPRKPPCSPCSVERWPPARGPAEAIDRRGMPGRGRHQAKPLRRQPRLGCPLPLSRLRLRPRPLKPAVAM